MRFKAFAAFGLAAALSVAAAGAEATKPPALSLPDLAGKTVNLSDFQGKSPVLVVFYRGYW
ncbi:MAG: hypothetical protein U0002_00040 [Thermoanaerobaculia bacterium]